MTSPSESTELAKEYYPPSYMAVLVGEILGNPEKYKNPNLKKLTQLLAQEYSRGRTEALNKVREQANGSFEVRTPKEPEYMIWEIAEWQLKDIEKGQEDV